MRSHLRILPILMVCLLAVPACANQAAESEVELTTDEQKTLYALGLAMSQGLATLNLTDEEFALVKQGMTDGVMDTEPKVDLQEYGPKIQTLAQERAMAAAETERTEGASMLEKAATEEGAVKTDSGMVYIQTEAGSGASPAATDTVRVHYKGTLRSGDTFDSSYDRGTPATFPLNQVIPCWTEGLQMMQEGGKAKLICPPDLAYGDRPQGTIPPGSTLTFEVELLEVNPGANPPPAAAAPNETPAPEGGDGN